MAGTAGPSEARSSSSKVYSDLNNKAQEQASQFIERLRVQQGQHEAIAAAAANVNPDSAARGARVELWMKKLGLDRYVAGLRKDEMAASYQSSETDDESGLHDLCENGWRGRLFPKSLAALAEAATSDVSSSKDGEEDSDGSTQDQDGQSQVYRYLRYTKRQEQSLQHFADEAATCSDNSNNGDEDPYRKVAALKEPAIAISRFLIQQHLAGSPFESPLLAYAAMLSVNSRYGCWEEPGSFNHHLSALIYCGQLWTFRFACDAVDEQRPGGVDEEESDDGLDEELDAQMRRYFTNTVSKPLSYLLLWRRRLFGIAPLTMVNRPAT
ncbi:hypothetical protein H2203_005307 [Taxawa tesnikishii (nom. ined.)]|nr:hypothetical protein H2203_005307 [Dothideales sp. JES 119]